jgi:hypothetical protein
MDVKEHMEVVGSDSQRVGTVNKIEGDHIKLNKKDSSDGQYHFVEKHLVSGIVGKKVKLSVKATEAGQKAA